MKLDARCQKIELVISDVDGVLTNGQVVFDNQGIEIKYFHIHDGLGIQLWQQAGFRFAVLTSRTSHIVKIRAAELGIELVRQGFATKLPVARELAESLNLKMDQVAYIGDDLPDLQVVKAAGLGIAVANAVPEVRAAADHILEREGGCGAVREALEMILKAKKRWDVALQKYM